MLSGLFELPFATHTSKSRPPTTFFCKAGAHLKGLFAPCPYFLSRSVPVLSLCGALTMAAMRASQIAPDLAHNHAALEHH